MSTDIVRATTHAEVRQLCEDIAHSSILPAHFQGKAANVLVALMAADALGIDKFTALQEMYVVNGKLGMSASLTQSLVRRAGHRFRVLDSSATAATVEIVRHDDPEAPFRVTFTMDDAKRANLSGSNWQKFPAAMLLARATTACARMACAEALSGLAYTKDELSDGRADDELIAEELGDDTLPAEAYPQTSGAAREEASAPSHPAQSTPDEGAAPEPDIEDAIVVDETTGEVGGTTPGYDRTTGAPIAYGPGALIDPKSSHSRRMYAMLRERVTPDKGESLEWLSAQVGRVLTSSKDITQAEQSRILDTLDTLAPLGGAA